MSELNREREFKPAVFEKVDVAFDVLADGLIKDKNSIEKANIAERLKFAMMDELEEYGISWDNSIGLYFKDREIYVSGEVEALQGIGVTRIQQIMRRGLGNETVSMRCKHGIECHVLDGHQNYQIRYDAVGFNLGKDLTMRRDNLIFKASNALRRDGADYKLRFRFATSNIVSLTSDIVSEDVLERYKTTLKSTVDAYIFSMCNELYPTAYMIDRDYDAERLRRALNIQETFEELETYLEGSDYLRMAQERELRIRWKLLNDDFVPYLFKDKDSDVWLFTDTGISHRAKHIACAEFLEKYATGGYYVEVDQEDI